MRSLALLLLASACVSPRRVAALEERARLVENRVTVLEVLRDDPQALDPLAPLNSP